MRVLLWSACFFGLKNEPIGVGFTDGYASDAQCAEFVFDVLEQFIGGCFSREELDFSLAIDVEFDQRSAVDRLTISRFRRLNVAFDRATYFTVGSDTVMSSGICVEQTGEHKDGGENECFHNRQFTRLTAERPQELQQWLVNCRVFG